MRRPQHTFLCECRPFHIQPFLIAPVLPGETLKNLLLQSRVVTDPIKNPITGWWLEYYVFYVKMRDTYERDEYEQMVLNPAYDHTAMDATASSDSFYTYLGAVDSVKHCYNRVVDVWFRDDDETYDLAAGVDNTLSMAHVKSPGWLDSYIVATDYATQDVDLIDAATTDVLTVSEFKAAMREWELSRANMLTMQSFEEFVAQYTNRVPSIELHEPELIRYTKEWSYPTNTVDPTNGTPRSAVSWAVTERADKDRYFAEPGWVFGVTVARPKMYLSSQQGAAAGMLKNVYAWQPPILEHDPDKSMLVFTDDSTSTSGPLLAAAPEAYRVDVRDLFMYGDQFLGTMAALSGADGTRNLYAWNDNRRYLDDTDLDALFVTSTDLTTQRVRHDGVVHLNIATTLKDQTLGIVGNTLPQ